MNGDRIYDEKQKKIYLSRIGGSLQENDLTSPVNFGGYGRIHHFKLNGFDDWIPNPLPIVPASKYLNLDIKKVMKVQCFQVALCNLSCWYCYVPNELKDINKCHGKWFSCHEIIESIASNPTLPRVVVLSGGNPELAPRWCLDMMQQIEVLDMKDEIYLWSDDALSGNYFENKLSLSEIKYMTDYPGYGKVCCFKGFDDYTCKFNSGNQSITYERQYENFRKYFNMGFDLYGYITFTTPDLENIYAKLKRFIDSLKSIHPLLPLKIVPLKIVRYSTLRNVTPEEKTALDNQFRVLEVWQELIHKEYSTSQINMPISDIIPNERRL